MSLLGRYTHWLHTRWPAGTVEKLPEIRADGTTAVPGVRIVGDLTGIPLLKFSSDSGARAIRAILAEPDFARTRGAGDAGVVDVAIVGGGVSGIAAAIEAKKAGLSFVVFEASEVFSTVANFPKAKPIYTYPTGMTPAGDLQFRTEVHPKEQLLADLESLRKKAGIDVTSARIERISRQDGLLRLHHGDGKTVTRARRAIVAIGRSGNHRRLGVPGEDSGKVFNRVYDPKDFTGRQVLVVGGGGSAPERARGRGSARHAVLPQEGVRAAEARERREDPDAREESVRARRRRGADVGARDDGDRGFHGRSRKASARIRETPSRHRRPPDRAGARRAAGRLRPAA